MVVFVRVMTKVVLSEDPSFVEKHGLLHQFSFKIYPEERSSVFDQRDGIPLEDS
jgi:hypothetical protein